MCPVSELIHGLVKSLPWVSVGPAGPSFSTIGLDPHASRFHMLQHLQAETKELRNFETVHHFQKLENILKKQI